LCTLYYASTQAKQLAKREHSLILTKNNRSFLPVGDISACKSSKYCILQLEHTAPCIKSRIKLKEVAKHDHSLILTKNDRNFHPVGDISTFKRPNYCILGAEHSTRCTMRRHKPNSTQTRSFVNYDEK
jgi:hypothetical protein